MQAIELTFANLSRETIEEAKRDYSLEIVEKARDFNSHSICLVSGEKEDLKRYIVGCYAAAKLPEELSFAEKFKIAVESIGREDLKNL